MMRLYCPSSILSFGIRASTTRSLHGQERMAHSLRLTKAILFGAVSRSRLISPISESQNFGFVKNTYGSMTNATVTTRILTGNRIFPPVPSSQGNPALVSASPHRLHIFKHTYTKKGKHTGSFMPYADASAKANQSFGTLQTTGIYLYEAVFSNTVNSPTSIPQYLLLSSGRLSMRTNVH